MAEARKSVLVASPFGMGGEYNGPAVLLDRLMAEVGISYGAPMDVLTATSRAAEFATPGWARTVRRVTTKRQGRGHRWQQTVWAVRVSAHLLLRRKEYGWVHFHGAYVDNLMAATVSRWLGMAYCLLPVLEDGDLSERAPWRRVPLLRATLLKTIAGASSGFALSSGISDEFRRDGLQRVARIGNAVADSYFAISGVRQVRPPTLGFVGKLGPRKRPELVLGALKALGELGIRSHALFVGPFESAEFEERFLKNMADLGVGSSVTLAGYLADPSGIVTSSMDFLVLPSASEGMPGAVCEAMAAGVPVLVTDVGAMGQVVIESGAGLIVEPSVDSIVGAVRYLLDDARYQTFSSRARQYAREHYSVAAVARVYCDALLAAEGPRDGSP